MIAALFALQLGGPPAANGQVTVSGRPQRAAATVAGAAWGSPRTGQVHERDREEAPTSSVKRRRVQTALFRDGDSETPK